MFAGSTMTAPCRLHVGDRRFGQAIGRRAVAEQPVADDADARALQAVRIERNACSRARAGPRRPWSRHPPDRPRHRARAAARRRRRVRAIGPAVSWLCAIGTMPVRLTSPSVGLMPTSALTLRRTTRSSRRFRCRSRRRPGSRPRRRRIPSSSRDGLRSSAYGISRLAAARAPAARRMGRSEVRPLAQVRLAEDDRAGLAQPRDDERVARRGARRRAPAIRPSSACDPPVAMLSLMRIGMPCSGPRDAAVLPLGVEAVGDRRARRD